MLKYSTAVNNEDGIVSPRNELEYMRNTLQVSAGTKTGNKMAIKKRGLAKRALPRDRPAPEMSHLPPISTPNSPQNGMIMTSSDKRDSYVQNQPLKRKEIRTPYVSHINRISDVATPYVLHANFSNIEPSSALGRENSKLSGGNVLELRREPELRHEATFSSLQKYPSANSPRPKGRHGRHKHSSFNEIDIDRNGDLRELTIQSNQIGLNKRVERKQRDTSRGKGDESFSIRKKIEQFRKWHEEQYREKIKKLKKEVDDQFEAENTRLTRQVGGKRETPTSKNDLMTPDDKIDLVPSEMSLEKMDEDKITPILSSTNETSKPRTESGRTWHTWRNVNDSYAYNDVQKYIKENELMDDEKATWIKKWIIEVNKAMKDSHQESFL